MSEAPSNDLANLDLSLQQSSENPRPLSELFFGGDIEPSFPPTQMTIRRPAIHPNVTPASQ